MVPLQADNITQYLAYFEEPEPGVMVGYSGWYHSGGQFALHLPGQVFNPEDPRSPIHPEVTGPFASAEEALASLLDAMSELDDDQPSAEAA